MWSTYTEMIVYVKLKMTILKTGHLYSAYSCELASKAFRMARVTGSHSFTCLYLHAYPAFTPQLQSITALWPVLISGST